MQQTAIIQTNSPAPVLSAEIIQSIVLQGDMSKLNPTQKVQYYNYMCERVGIDPSTQPFKLMKLNGKEILYCDKTGAQQLNRKYGLSQEVSSREVVNDIYVVTSRTSDPSGRFCDSIGAVPIANQKGEALANAMMKADTKSKRRGTLEFCGLGMLDETEVSTIPGVQHATVEPEYHTVSLGQSVAEAPQLVKKSAPVEVTATTMEDVFTITEVKSAKTGTSARGNWTLWVVATEEGLNAITFDDELARQAQAILAIDGKAILMYHENDKGKMQLDAVEQAPQQEHVSITDTFTDALPF